MSKEYLSLDIAIGPIRAGKCSVKIKGPAGEFDHIAEFPFADDDPANQILNLKHEIARSLVPRRRMDTSWFAAREFGQKLFDIAFSGASSSILRESLQAADRRGAAGVRIVIRSEEPKLIYLPWEYLYSKAEDKFCGISARTPIIRCPDMPRAQRPLKIHGKLGILVVAPDPLGMPYLDIPQEKDRLEEALGPLERANLVEIDWLTPCKLTDLAHKLREEEKKYHILHFVGHGGFSRVQGQGVLYFRREDGEPHEVSAASLGDALRDYDSIKLVVLNSCEGAAFSDSDIFSSSAAKLVQHGIPAVLAMQFEISDAAAIRFTKEFYLALSTGMPIDVAASEARKLLTFIFPNSIEWGIPVVHMHSLNGNIFEVPKRNEGFRVKLEDLSHGTTKGTKPGEVKRPGVTESEQEALPAGAPEERIQREAEEMRRQETLAAQTKAEQERIQHEAEEKRRQEALAAQAKAEQERIQHEAEEKRRQEALAAQAKAEQERIQREAEEKRRQEALAAQAKAEQERIQHEAEEMRRQEALAAQAKAEQERIQREAEEMRRQEALAAQAKAERERIRREAEEKRKQEALAAQAKAEQERIRREAEEKRKQEVSAAQAKAEQERIRREAEEKRKQEVSAAQAKAEQERIRREAEEKRKQEAMAAQAKAERERIRREAEEKRKQEALAVQAKAEQERIQREVEEKRKQEAMAAQAKAEQERIQREVEEKRKQEAMAAQAKAEQERIQREAEEKRKQEALASQAAAKDKRKRTISRVIVLLLAAGALVFLFAVIKAPISAPPAVTAPPPPTTTTTPPVPDPDPTPTPTPTPAAPEPEPESERDILQKIKDATESKLTAPAPAPDIIQKINEATK